MGVKVKRVNRRPVIPKVLRAGDAQPIDLYLRDAVTFIVNLDLLDELFNLVAQSLLLECVLPVDIFVPLWEQNGLPVLENPSRAAPPRE